MAVKKITKFLEYIFSDTELEEMSTSVMENIGKIDELTGQKKASNKSFSDKINGLHGENSEVAGKILHGSETREIACEVTYNSPKDGQKTIVRMDTMESWTEDMTEYENTIDNLPLPGANMNEDDEEALQDMEEAFPDEEISVTKNTANKWAR